MKGVAVNKVVLTEYRSPVGLMVLGAYNDAIVMSDWASGGRFGLNLRRICCFLDAASIRGESEMTAMAKLQLDSYFAHELKQFNLPLLLCGTDFQQRVWRALMKVEYGRTESYSGLARSVSHPTGVRAVASAVACNPLSIIVPCHRIVAKNGGIGGYAGGLDAKRQLLGIELNPSGLFSGS